MPDDMHLPDPQAQQEYQSACTKFAEHSKATDELLLRREQCYIDLLHLNQASQQQLSTAQAATAGVSQVTSKVSLLCNVVCSGA